MKRQEEMRIALEQYAEPSFPTNEEEFAFMAGFRTAEKIIINKACECIIKLHNWPTQYEEFARFQEEFITAFRKAMEE